MTDKELIARLRDFDPHLHEWEVVDEAADRIEALIAERDEADDLAKAAFADGASNNIRLAETSYRVKWLEAKLEKAVEALLWCSGSADFNEGGVAREGWLKVCAPLLKGESHE